MLNNIRNYNAGSAYNIYHGFRVWDVVMHQFNVFF